MERKCENPSSSSSKNDVKKTSGGFDREMIRLQLASDDDDLDVCIVDPTSSTTRRRRFSDDGFLEVTLNDITEEAEAETAAILGAFPPSNAQDACAADAEVENVSNLQLGGSSSRGGAAVEPLPLPKNAFHDVCDRLRKETEIQLAQVCCYDLPKG